MLETAHRSNKPSGVAPPVTHGDGSRSRLLRLVLVGVIYLASRRAVPTGERACVKQPNGAAADGQTEQSVREPAPMRGGFGMVLFLFVAFVPLAFSEDFIAAVSDVTRTEPHPDILVAVDSALLAFLFFLTVWLRKPSSEDARSWSFAPWWIAGATLTLATDMALISWIERESLWIDMGSSVLYIVSLALIVAATVGVNPSRIRTRGEWIRVRPMVPLLVGTLAAYVGTILWSRFLLGDGVARSISDAQLMAERIGLQAVKGAKTLIWPDRGLCVRPETIVRWPCRSSTSPSYRC
jgi:hypothetical protein